MNRGLLLALAATGGLSLWLMLAPDEPAADAGDLLPPQRQARATTGPTAAAARPAVAPAGGHDRPTADTTLSMPPNANGSANGHGSAGAASTGATRSAPVRAEWPAPSALALAAWQPPAPPPPPPAPVAPSTPPRPAPPAFPYQWIGRLQDGALSTALLNGPQRSLAVAEGQAIDPQWRLDRIAERQLSLTWLPGGDTVTVAAKASP